jgi:hypothetical protein
VYNSSQYDKAVLAAVATDTIQNSDQRFIAYKIALAGNRRYQ